MIISSALHHNFEGVLCDYSYFHDFERKMLLRQWNLVEGIQIVELERWKELRRGVEGGGKWRKKIGE